MQGKVMFMDEANEEVWTRYNQYDITPVRGTGVAGR